MQAKATQHLTKTLLKMSDFQSENCTQEETESYAKAIVDKLYSVAADKEEFRDRLLAIMLNIENLDGELRGGQKITPEVVATMDAAEMLSAKQRKKEESRLRKRLREQENYDKTSMYCPHCGLVRRDRLNINQMGLDSEENGTHFDYNFGNLCECSERSSSSSSTDSESSSDESQSN